MESPVSPYLAAAHLPHLLDHQVPDTVSPQTHYTSPTPGIRAAGSLCLADTWGCRRKRKADERRIIRTLRANIYWANEDIAGTVLSTLQIIRFKLDRYGVAIPVSQIRQQA